MKAVAARWRAGAERGRRGRRRAATSCPFCKSHDAQVEAIEALVRAVRVGARSPAGRRWTTPCARMRALKERFLLPYRDPDPERARRRPAADGAHRALARGDRRRAAASRPERGPSSPGRCGPATWSASARRRGRSTRSGCARGVGRARAAGLRGARSPTGCWSGARFTAGTRRATRLADLHALFADDERGRHRLRARRRRARAGCCRASTARCCARTPRSSWLQRRHVPAPLPRTARPGDLPRPDGRRASWPTARYDRASFLAARDGRGRALRERARRARCRCAPGTAEGVLRGGCLSLLAAAAGTPWALRGRDEADAPLPRGRGRDAVPDRPHAAAAARVGRASRACAGIVFGDMKGCTPALRRRLHAGGRASSRRSPASTCRSRSASRAATRRTPTSRCRSACARGSTCCGDEARFEVLEAAVA